MPLHNIYMSIQLEAYKKFRQRLKKIRQQILSILNKSLATKDERNLEDIRRKLESFK